MDFYLADDIKKLIVDIAPRSKFTHIDTDFLICFRSKGSTGRAIARIWSLPRIWQMALNVKPHYCIEVISERFDKLSFEDKQKTLIHELMHIPKTFSGALVPHRTRYRKIDRNSVEKIFRIFKDSDWRKIL